MEILTSTVYFSQHRMLKKSYLRSGCVIYYLVYYYSNLFKKNSHTFDDAIYKINSRNFDDFTLYDISAEINVYHTLEKKECFQLIKIAWNSSN